MQITSAIQSLSQIPLFMTKLPMKILFTSISLALFEGTAAIQLCGQPKKKEKKKHGLVMYSSQ
jgi:hypothetical protein